MRFLKVNRANGLTANLLKWGLPLLFVLVSCPVTGQVLHQLTEKDYGLWSRLYNGGLSDDGKWSCYTVTYESGIDTLFLKRTDGKVMHRFPRTAEGQFFGTNGFACLAHDGILNLKNLRTSRTVIVDSVNRFELLKAGYLVAEIAAKRPVNILTFYDSKGAEIKRIENVAAWSYNRASDVILYQHVTQGKPEIYLLECGKQFLSTKVAACGTAPVTDIAWQENGQSVTFISHENLSAEIGFYSFASGKYLKLTTAQLSLPSLKTITATSFSPVKISADGRKVYFAVGDGEIKEITATVQNWNTQDKVIYPERTMLKSFGKAEVYCWETGNGRIEKVTDSIFPECMVSPDYQHILLWNRTAYEPQQKSTGDEDYYLTGNLTGDRKLLLEKQYGDESLVFFSPLGRYVTYYWDGAWWIYDLVDGKSVNLTRKLKTSFADLQYDWPGDVPPYGCAGWEENDQSILLYDRYDIWKISVDGTAVRLTKGRESKSVFRIEALTDKERGGINFSGHRTGSFNLLKGFWIKGVKDKKAAYYFWSEPEGLRQVAESQYSLSDLKTTSDGEVISYMEQSYQHSPRLMFKSRYSVSKKIFQSNPQHFKYAWGKSELIKYKNSKGESLEGILYYPADYDPNKKYPVVTWIYEKMSPQLYEYVNPTKHTMEGYNKTIFTTNGYFVFEPDINYIMGSPGLSALDCVESSVKAILDIPGVDRLHIGLMGHSFGGYETYFIIGKSKLFAAAVAGAGIADLTSHFLRLNNSLRKPNNYHFEYGEFRMPKSLFDDRDNYAANSPLTFVQDVKTPLLSWTGENDMQVLPGQSMEYHLALRRLGKPGTMLIYPNEIHALVQRDDQEDLTDRILDWFNFYLKQMPEPDWMKPSNE